MSRGETLETVVSISGTLSPDLLRSITVAIDSLGEMEKEIIESAGAAAKLAAEMNAQESVLKDLQKQYVNFVVSGDDSSEQANELASTIQHLSRELEENKDVIREAQKAAERLADTQDDVGGASDNLRKKISSQESELQALKKSYSDIILEQGQNSKEAKKLAGQIEDLSGELSDNQKQLRETEQAADILGKTLVEAGESAKGSSEGYTVLKNVIANLATDAIRSAVDSFRELAFEGDAAISSLTAKVGTSADEIGSYTDVLYDVYNSNYGESLDDVSRSLATVIQMTDGLDQASLENVTKSAIALDEIFEFETTESLRAVNSLMDQFGLTSEDAFNLIAQGAQNGLNQNDDLLDTINEYAVQFRTAGYSAEDMFNMLKNGVDAGTWSVDKLGDAVKEFNIRMSDDSAGEHIEKLGLDAERIGTQFNAGGEDAQKAIAEIMSAIQDTDDATAQYAIGVGLFGTMWEDLGLDTVASLMNTQGAISQTIDAMGEIDSVAYDTLEKSFSHLGRTLKAEVLQPVAESLTPIIKDAVQFATENIGPTVQILQEKFTELWQFLDKNFSPAISLISENLGPHLTEAFQFVTEHLSEMIQFLSENAGPAIEDFAEGLTNAVQWVVDNIPTATVLLAGLAAAMVAFKWGAIIAQLGVAKAAIIGFGLAIKTAVMAVNPIGLIILAITAAAAALTYLWNNSEEFRNFWISVWDGIKEVVSNVGEFFGSVVDSIADAFSGLGEFFSSVPEGIAGIFSGLGEFFGSVVDGIAETFSGIGEPIGLAFEYAVEAVHSVFGGLKDWFSDSVVRPIADTFSKIWCIANTATSAYQALVDAWVFASEWFKTSVITPIVEAFTGAWTAVSDVASSTWQNLTSGASAAWEGIKSVFSTAADFFGSTFSTAWERVKAVFSSGGAIFAGITEGIVATFTRVVNTIIGGINKAVSIPFNAINSALDTIRAVNIAGLSPFAGLPSISVMQIPLLAAGGMTDGISIAGEAGREAVISFDPAFREQNIKLWEQTGELLGVYNSDSATISNTYNTAKSALEAVPMPDYELTSTLNNFYSSSALENSIVSTSQHSFVNDESLSHQDSYTASAGRLLSLDNFSLGEFSTGQTVIYNDFSGFTWSPQIEAKGIEDNDDFMDKLKAHEAEFFDWLEEFIHAKEAASYA